jgi:uncharacterized membrane protein YfcA
MRLAPAVAIGFAATIGLSTVGDIIQQTISGFPLPSDDGTLMILVGRATIGGIVGGALAAALSADKKQSAGYYVSALLVLKIVYVAVRQRHRADTVDLIAFAVLPALGAIVGAQAIESRRRRRAEKAGAAV